MDTRRAGKMIYYRLASSEARQVIELLYQLFLQHRRQVAARRAARPEGLEWAPAADDSRLG